MRAFRTPLFKKYQKKEGITDESLQKAVREMKAGLYEANLGGHVFKKRVAKAGRGKSGGTRAIIAYKSNERLIFMFGFAKNNVENITEEELGYLKKLAKYFLGMGDHEIASAIQKNELEELDDA